MYSLFAIGVSCMLLATLGFLSCNVPTNYEIIDEKTISYIDLSGRMHFSSFKPVKDFAYSIVNPQKIAFEKPWMHYTHAISLYMFGLLLATRVFVTTRNSVYE